MLKALSDFIDIRYFLRIIKGRIYKRNTRVLNPDIAELSEDWQKISVESVLNSRCSSDFDNNSSINHWGMANGEYYLSEIQLKKVEQYAHFKTFLTSNTGLERKINELLFYYIQSESISEKELQLIKCGKTIQACNLICAAMGISVIVQNMGVNGKEISGKRLGILQYKLAPMKPSYNGKYWTNSAPGKERSWHSGNLPDPDRRGRIPLVTALANIANQIQGKEKSDIKKLSQLLWATRGRTPHFYMSKAWGVTIPLAYGSHDRSDVVVALPDKSVQQYINWFKGRPTHSLKKLDGNHSFLIDKLKKKFPSRNTFILLRSFNDTGHALLEIGFMLQNLLVQAAALNISLESTIDLQEFEIDNSPGKIRAVVAVAA